MGDVTLMLTDRHGVRIGELVGAALDECVWELNAPGSASVSINPLRKAANWIDLNKTEIQVWIDDVYRHCVIPRAVQGNSKKITFQCEGILSYLSYAHVNDTLEYGSPPSTFMEQFQIAWNLVSYAQTATNKDRRIASSAWTPSGVSRLRKWEWYDHQNILDALSEFPTVDNGFDFEVVLFGDGRREWTMYYPKKGTTRANLVLEWGRNIVDYNYGENGQEQATKVYATGGTSGETHFEANVENVALSAEYGVYEKIVAEGSELDTAWLTDRATEEVAFYGRPTVLPELIVKDIPASGDRPAVKLDGVLNTGDVVPVRAVHGRCRMNGNYRIHRITRTKNGRLSLAFNEDR